MPDSDALTSLREEGAAPFIFAGIDTDLFLNALRQRIESSRAAFL
jgi:hypothetical protein